MKKESNLKTNSITIIRQLLKLPGVKVNRTDFLLKTFEKKIKTEQEKVTLLQKGPVEVFSQEVIEAEAKKVIMGTTHKASFMSFAAGLPGGFAILGTLPADTIQMYAMTLKMAQELSYLYGAEDIWIADREVDTEAEDKLIVYLGAMLGVNTAASATRLISNTLTKVLLEQTTQQAVHQGILHQVAKKVLKTIGVKSSKKGVSSGMAKLIPIAGGLFSGGLTYFGVKPMGFKLNEVLKEGVYGYHTELLLEDAKTHGLDDNPLLVEQLTEKATPEEQAAAKERLEKKSFIPTIELKDVKKSLFNKFK